jgi:hypothetical protein
MLAQFGANIAAVRSAVAALLKTPCGVSVAIAAAALTLGGCVPTTVPFAGADPADPKARVAGVGYRSTIAPYTGLRPTTPLPWREQNDRVAPAPKPDR